MPKQDDFPVIFEKLKRILQSCDGQFTVKVDKPDNYYLDGPYSERFKKDLFFGSVQIKKNYVSFYLMPVYMFPDLLEGIPADLKKRMQGKSCFNFTSLDEELIGKVAELTSKSLARVRQEKAFVGTTTDVRQQMKILAIERELPGATDDEVQTHLKLEALRAWELYQADVLRELYFRQDQSTAVLVLECANTEEASRVLASLPLVKAGLITFDLMPLIPYPGFSRLFG